MKKTVDINISNIIFHVDEDAYQLLKAYLEKLESVFENQEGGKEILSDIENRIAELFETKTDRQSEVITLEIVNDIMATMGKPEDFGFETEDKSTKEEVYEAEIIIPKKRLYRDIDNKVLGGICSGLAAYFNIDVVWIRVLAVVLLFATSGGAAFVYIILWLIIPPAISRGQKMEMHGENVTIENIERAIKEEYEEMKKGFQNFKDSPTYKKGESWFKNMSNRNNQNPKQ